MDQANSQEGALKSPKTPQRRTWSDFPFSPFQLNLKESSAV